MRRGQVESLARGLGALLIGTCAGACTEVRTVAVPAAALRCDGDQRVTLAQHLSADIEGGLVPRVGGHAAFYVDDRSLVMAHLAPDGSLQAGPFRLGSNGDFRSVRVVRVGPSYLLAFNRRIDGTVTVFTGWLDGNAPEQGLSRVQRAIETADGSSRQRLALDAESRPWLGWVENRQVGLGLVEGGSVPAPAYYEPGRPPRLLDLTIRGDVFWALIEVDDEQRLLRLDSDARLLGTAWVGEGGPVTLGAASLTPGSADAPVRLAWARSGTVTVATVDAGGQLTEEASYAAVGDVAALSLQRGSGGPLAVAWLDDQGSAWLAFVGRDEQPRRLDTSTARPGLSLLVVPGGALVAYEQEEPESVLVERRCL